MAGKVTDRETLVAAIAAAKGLKRKVGFTSGAFDLLHAGHARYLEHSKQLCDVLVVGVNSDQSVQKLKGDKRPIVSESERAELVAALAVVDYVFIFSEQNNNRNIELLKPDLYIKAGDYTTEKLSSAKIVESYGGKVEIVKFEQGLSTSGIVDRICGRYLAEYQGSATQNSENRGKPALFVDRDGTIIEHVEYLHSPDQVVLIPGALEALLELKNAGYAIVIVTNQPGISLGYFTKEDFFRTNTVILKAASKIGLTIDKIYFSHHSDADKSPYRKPEIGMIKRAEMELGIDLAQSIVVGDMTIDLEMAHRAGIASVLVETGKGGKDGRFKATPSKIIPSLAALPGAVRELRGEYTPNANFDSSKLTSAGGGVAITKSRLLEAIGFVGARLGHDLNNLMGAIQCSTDLVKLRLQKNSVDNKSLSEQIGIIDASVQKTLAIAKRIRGFVRPGELVIEPINISQLISSVEAALRPELANNVSLIFEGCSDLRIDGNEFQLLQVFAGLILNAVEACQNLEDSSVIVLTDEVDQAPGVDSVGRKFARIAIIDHGKGMDYKTGERVFEPLATSTENAAIGEGLGLTIAMANEAIIRHGGSITIQSAVGRGTRVSIYLPISSSAGV